MEVIRRWWWACVLSLGALLEEVCFRLVLTAEVLIGRVPLRGVERGWWNRATESPVLIDVLDWTTERLLFSILVWPRLESAPHTAERDHRERVEEVLDAIAKGASQKMWSTCWEVSELTWDHHRECWVDADSHAYDGARLYEYSRGGVGGRSY